MDRDGQEKPTVREPAKANDESTPESSASVSSCSEPNERTIEDAERDLLAQMNEETYVNPHGVYRLAYLHRKRRQRELSAVSTMPERTIGSVGDTFEDNDIECSCRKGRCLMLYCECFQSSTLCNSKCTCDACHNNDRHLDERHQVVLTTIVENPNAFKNMIKQKRKKTNLQSQQDSKGEGCQCTSDCSDSICPCYDNGLSCDARFCACRGCGNDGFGSEVETRNRKRMEAKHDTDHNIDSRVLPAMLNGDSIEGLAFSKTARQSKVPTRAADQNGNGVKSKQIKHDLMLSGFTSQNDRVKGRYEPSVVASIQREIQRANEFFWSIGKDSDSGSETETNFETEHIFPSLRSTLDDVSKAMTVAKQDVLERRWEEKSTTVNPTCQPEQEEGSDLLCAESFPIPDRPLSEQQLDTLSTLAVKDTALIREATRYINQITRELYEERQSK